MFPCGNHSLGIGQDGCSAGLQKKTILSNQGGEISQGLSSHFCDTRETPPFYGGVGLWEAFPVVSRKWIPGPHCLIILRLGQGVLSLCPHNRTALARAELAGVCLCLWATRPSGLPLEFRVGRLALARFGLEMSLGNSTLWSSTRVSRWQVGSGEVRARNVLGQLDPLVFHSGFALAGWLWRGSGSKCPWATRPSGLPLGFRVGRLALARFGLEMSWICRWFICGCKHLAFFCG